MKKPQDPRDLFDKPIVLDSAHSHINLTGSYYALKLTSICQSIADHFDS